MWLLRLICVTVAYGGRASAGVLNRQARTTFQYTSLAWPTLQNSRERTTDDCSNSDSNGRAL